MSAHEGLEIGHAMADLAGNSAGETWKQLAYDVFVAHAAAHREFTTEDVRRANPELPTPPDNRAWGAIARRAMRDEIIELLCWTRAKNREVHGRVINCWKSNLCDTDQGGAQ